MRILFLDAYYPPEITADTQLEQDIIEKMVEKGWEIHVLCPTPTRGCSKEVIRQYRNIRRDIQMGGSVIVSRFWAPQEGKRASIRALRYIWCSLRMILLGRKQTKIDVIYSNSTPPIQGLVARYLKKKLKCKFIYSLQDLFPESLVTAGISSQKSLAYRVGLRIERKTYEACDEIITLSDSIRSTLIKKGVSGRKLHVVYNWIDTERIKHVEKEENLLFDELEIDRNKFTLLYAGNFGRSQNIDYIIDTAKELVMKTSVQFILFGFGTEYDRIKNRVNVEEINNVCIFPLMSPARIAEVYSMGDIDIICNAPGISKIGMPSKTWSIMATGTPVIAVTEENSELAETLNTYGCGWTVNPNSHNKMVSLISNIVDNSGKLDLKCVGKNCRECAKKIADKNIAIESLLSYFPL